MASLHIYHFFEKNKGFYQNYVRKIQKKI